MKYVILMLALCCAGPLQAAQIWVAISPFQAREAVGAQLEKLNVAFSHLPGGTQVKIIDAHSTQEITTIKIPTHKFHRHEKALAGRFKRDYLKVYFHVVQSNSTGQFPGGADVPRLMNHLAEYAPDAMQLWLIASPVYAPAENAQFSMAGQLIPSDGMIKTTYPDVPFGTSGRKDGLAHLRVHWWHPAPVNGVAYGEALRRFWFLYLDALGAKPVTYSPDAALIVERIGNGSAPLQMRYIAGEDDKIIMQHIRPLTPQRSLFEAPISTAPVPDNNQSIMSIGVQWAQSGVDLDLHVRPAAQADTLSFRNQSTDYGRHFKDILSGTHSTATQYETIDITRPTVPKEVRIIINHYGGHARQDITGTIRVSMQGRVYALPFTLRSRNGNKGTDVGAVMQSATHSQHTLIFTPTQIFNQHTSIQETAS